MTFNQYWPQQDLRPYGIRFYHPAPHAVSAGPGDMESPDPRIGVGGCAVCLFHHGRCRLFGCHGGGHPGHADEGGCRLGHVGMWLVWRVHRFVGEGWRVLCLWQSTHEQNPIQARRAACDVGIGPRDLFGRLSEFIDGWRNDEGGDGPLSHVAGDARVRRRFDCRAALLTHSPVELGSVLRQPPRAKWGRG